PPASSWRLSIPRRRSVSRISPIQPMRASTRNGARFSNRSVARGAFMADDVVLNKAAIIERCVARVREEYADDPRNLTDNITRQDSIILNLQRACEAAIDLAMHVVRRRRLGVPQETRDAFRL